MKITSQPAGLAELLHSCYVLGFVWFFCSFVCLCAFVLNQGAIHVFGYFFSDISGLVKESHLLTRSSSNLMWSLICAFLKKDTACCELSNIDILPFLFLLYPPFFSFKCIWEPFSGSLSKYLMLHTELHDQKTILQLGSNLAINHLAKRQQKNTWCHQEKQNIKKSLTAELWQ